MTVTVKHSKTNAISDWTQAQLDEQISLGNFAPGTTLANIVLPSDWNNDHTLTGIGTMAEQDANSVAITGGTINNASIGATTASTGKFTSVTTPSVTASSTDLTLSAISTGAVKFSTEGGLQGQFNNTASTVNYFDMYGSATTKAIQFKVAGTDTNISMAFQPKGTGAIDLAAGSSGVNISNGGTVTAITRTNAGSGYTSVPSVAITAPTTAGGVQATATAQVVINGVTNIANGGTGYTVGDVLTVSGGTAPSQTTQLTVSTVSAGVITAVTITRFGTYTVTPSNPASVTGGTGSGATFNLNYAVQSGTFTITNAGSGYIEQPTITFSGGGGSGASAYATVGSGTVIRSLGSTLSFHTPAGEGFRVYEPSGTVANYWAAAGGTSGNTPFLFSTGTDTNVSGRFTSKGIGSLTFLTNGGSQIQFNVSHTASAVNYVQVTGATTTNPPAITAQGSDANIPLAIASKGTSGVRLQTAGSTSQAIVNHIASAVNQIGISGNIAGSAPSLSAQGSDTNIDLALTPKGTGRVKFGTYTANMALTVQGYIEIVDSGGTIRKLAVIA